jgi:hypothetical protein
MYHPSLKNKSKSKKVGAAAAIAAAEGFIHCSHVKVAACGSPRSGSSDSAISIPL